MNAHSAIVVDDEPLACERIRAMLRGTPEVEVAGTYVDPLEALAAIEALRPDVLFLDVQMPQLDGFGLLEALDAKRRPAAIVFVTAHDRYALRAFEVNAVDYLLKPFTKSRFDEALSRALQKLSAADGNRAEIERLLHALRSEHPSRDRFVAWYRDGLHVVRAADVDWFEADRNYVSMHVGEIVYSVRSTFATVEERLDPAHFVRVHRSAIVNIDRLVRLEPWVNGQYVAILRNGARLQVSRTYGVRLRRALELS